MNKIITILLGFTLNFVILNYVGSEELNDNKSILIESKNKINNEIEKNPDKINLYLERGKLYFNNKEYELAIKDFNVVIEKEPNNIQGYLNRAKSFLAKKLFDEAISDYRIANTINPNNKEAYNGKKDATKYYAFELIKQGKQVEGKEKLLQAWNIELSNKIIENDQLSVNFFYALKYYYSPSNARRPERIIELLSEANNSHPLINEIKMVLADAFVDLSYKEFDLKNYEKTKELALLAKTIVSSIIPEYTPHRKVNEEDEISLEPENIKKMQIASPEKVKELKNDIDESIRLIFQVIAEDKIYHKDFKGAIIELEKLNKLYPNTEIYYTYIGYALFLNKQVKLSLKTMEKAVKLFPKSSEIYYQLALIHSLNKNKSLALKYLKKSVELNKKLIIDARNDKDFKYIQNEKIFKDIIK